jgi:iron(III) transport system ATP-binding protein
MGRTAVQLDAKLRIEMRQEIRHLQRRIGATILFVTHDQEEAMSLGDEIFLFNRERSFSAARRRSCTSACGAVRGGVPGQSQSVSRVIVTRGHDGVTMRRCRRAISWTKGTMAGTSPDGEALCMVRPEAWRVGPAGGPGVPARVQDTMFVGDRGVARRHVVRSEDDCHAGYVRFVEGDCVDALRFSRPPAPDSRGCVTSHDITSLVVAAQSRPYINVPTLKE